MYELRTNGLIYWQFEEIEINLAMFIWCYFHLSSLFFPPQTKQCEYVEHQILYFMEKEHLI